MWKSCGAAGMPDDAEADRRNPKLKNTIAGSANSSPNAMRCDDVM